MFKSLIQYSITRPIHLNVWVTVLLIFLGLFYLTAVSIFNIAAVGYGLVPVTSTMFNNPYNIWYERFIPHASWKAPNWICSGSIIGLNENGLNPLGI